MQDLPNVRLMLRLMLNPGWAPLLVVASYFALATTTLAADHDYIFHGLGGASIAYFAYVSIQRLPRPGLVISGGAHYVLAFALACTAAIFWEFAEYGANKYMDVMLQVTLEDTISDLFFGVVGAALFVAIAALMNRRSGIDEDA
jgi:hypothetical protein